MLPFIKEESKNIQTYNYDNYYLMNVPQYV